MIIIDPCSLWSIDLDTMLYYCNALLLVLFPCLLLRKQIPVESHQIHLIAQLKCSQDA
jgi:hypothetical protein